jgi:hypothetical protein
VKRTPDVGIFKPKPSPTEGKGDATTRAARVIIDNEAAATAAKTERLRAARLAREAIAEPVAVPRKEPRKR